MPTFEYRCANQHETTKFFRVRDYVEAVDCDQCDLAAVRIFTAPVMVTAQPDIAYDSPIDGKPITTHAARKDDMARHGCIEYDPEMKKDAARRTEDRQAALDRSVEQTVTREIAKLSPAKRQQLKKEVVNMGAGLEVNRL
jgi:hypothetical protein